MTDNELLTTTDVARMLKLSVVTLKRWRIDGKGPRWVRLEGVVRYRRADVERFIGSKPGGE